MMIIKNLIKQVYACLFCFRELLIKNISNLVVFILFLNTLGYVVFYKFYIVPYFIHHKAYAPWYLNFHEQGVMYCHGSLMFLLFMFAFSHKFNLSGKIAFIGLFTKWALSEIFIAFNLETGLYISTIMLAIYIIFLVFSLAKITKRI